VRRLLRLYPGAWRDRYESELAELLDELPADGGIALDLIRGAIGERARAVWRRLPEAPMPVGGGSPMLYRPLHRHPTILALVALLVVLPTMTMVFLSLLAYELGVTGLIVIVEPALAALNASQVVDFFLLVAPFLAFVVALIPLFGIGVSRADGELRLTFGFRARALNLVVIGLCVVVGGLLAGHILIEFLAEAR
jgi:hypothetical protein